MATTTQILKFATDFAIQHGQAPDCQSNVVGVYYLMHSHLKGNHTIQCVPRCTMLDNKPTVTIVIMVNEDMIQFNGVGTIPPPQHMRREMNLVGEVCEEINSLSLSVPPDELCYYRHFFEALCEYVVHVSRMHKLR
jgi:hypothetical protein